MSSGALAGIRVLELGDCAAYAGKLLADYGADVVLVEPPAGSVLRRQGPFAGDEPHPERSLPFLYYAGNKRSVTLSLDTADGRALFRRLAGTADVLLDGMEPGALEQHGLPYGELQAAFPTLVIAALTPFGRTGPQRDYRASNLVAFAAGGVMAVSGRPDGPPVNAPGRQGYDVPAIHTAFAILVALWERGVSGRGQLVDVSMQECLATEEHNISRYSEEGRSIRREGSQHEVGAPGSVLPCADGYVHFLISPSSAGIWERFYAWIGSPPELAGPEWADGRYRRAHVAELNAIVSCYTRQHTRAALYASGQANRITVVPVNTVGDFLATPQTQERGYLVPAQHPAIGDYDSPGAPFKLSATPWALRHAAPLVGEHNAELLGDELGLDAAARAVLRVEGAG